MSAEKCCARAEEIALSAHTPRRSNRSHSANPCARSAYDSSSSTCPVPANRRARGYRITSDSPHSSKFRTGSQIERQEHPVDISGELLAGDLGWEALLDRERRNCHRWANQKIVGVEELRHRVKDAVARALRFDDLF